MAPNTRPHLHLSTSFILAVLTFLPLAATEHTLSPPPSPLASCTTTITIYDHGFTGDFHPTITSTKYASTETATSLIDCHGCDELAITRERAPFWNGHGPRVGVTWVSATEVATVTTTVCSGAVPKPAAKEMRSGGELEWGW